MHIHLCQRATEFDSSPRKQLSETDCCIAQPSWLHLLLDNNLPWSFPYLVQFSTVCVSLSEHICSPFKEKNKDPSSGLPALWFLIQRMLAGNRPYSQFAWLMSCRRCGGRQDRENTNPQNPVVWKLQPKNHSLASLWCPFRKIPVPFVYGLAVYHMLKTTPWSNINFLHFSFRFYNCFGNCNLIFIITHTRHGKNNGRSHFF